VHTTWLHAWGSLYTSHKGELACSTRFLAARKAAAVEGGLHLGLVSQGSGQCGLRARYGSTQPCNRLDHLVVSGVSQWKKCNFQSNATSSKIVLSTEHEGLQQKVLCVKYKKATNTAHIVTRQDKVRSLCW